MKHTHSLRVDITAQRPSGILTLKKKDHIHNHDLTIRHLHRVLQKYAVSVESRSSPPKGMCGGAQSLISPHTPDPASFTKISPLAHIKSFSPDSRALFERIEQFFALRGLLAKINTLAHRIPNLISTKSSTYWKLLGEDILEHYQFETVMPQLDCSDLDSFLPLFLAGRGIVNPRDYLVRDMIGGPWQTKAEWEGKKEQEEEREEEEEHKINNGGDIMWEEEKNEWKDGNDEKEEKNDNDEKDEKDEKEGKTKDNSKGKHKAVKKPNEKKLIKEDEQEIYGMIMQLVGTLLTLSTHRLYHNDISASNLKVCPWPEEPRFSSVGYDLGSSFSSSYPSSSSVPVSVSCSVSCSVSSSLSSTLSSSVSSPFSPMEGEVSGSTPMHRRTRYMARLPKQKWLIVILDLGMVSNKPLETKRVIEHKIVKCQGQNKKNNRSFGQIPWLDICQSVLLFCHPSLPRVCRLADSLCDHVGVRRVQIRIHSEIEQSLFSPIAVWKHIRRALYH